MHRFLLLAALLAAFGAAVPAPALARARPDRLPPSYGANGVPDPVQRAVLLIGEGALDESTEDVLGQRIGLSGRQLRRLFVQHLGATPSFVARSRRAHFARRLLDESDLSVTEIGFAAGFNSIRQMNRRCSTPSASRRGAAREARERDRLGCGWRLPLRTPYGRFVRRLLGFLAARAVPGIEAIDATTYRRTITTCGHPGMIEVSDLGDRRHLLVLAHLPTYNALIDDVARVRRIFGLDQPAADHLPRSPATRCSRRSSRRGRDCACPARGTGSRQRCASS
jgi:AraC family transcriptional regulator of adaptative response / DNA-3-methyladenine glycosylase II